MLLKMDDLDYKILINDFINKKNNTKIDNLYYK